VTIAIEQVGARDVLGALLPDIPSVWTGVTSQRLREIVPRHASRAGFRFVVARTDRRLVGIAYGYLGARGQWWHDIVSKAMSRRDRARWLAPGHFELVELHVGPAYRRRGIGGTLHDALLDGLEGRTAVLSTQVGNHPARELYARRGWRVVIPRLRFGPGGEPYCILGLELPGSSGPA
jgi:ribosomal protein S18 acetylase RimI-like enzyme